MCVFVCIHTKSDKPTLLGCLGCSQWKLSDWQIMHLYCKKKKACIHLRLIYIITLRLSAANRLSKIKVSLNNICVCAVYIYMYVWLICDGFGLENIKIIKSWWWSDDNSLLLFVWTKRTSSNEQHRNSQSCTRVNISAETHLQNEHVFPYHSSILYLSLSLPYSQTI